MIGQTLGHYRVVEKIGAGGMGEVYRAHDEQLDRDVAAKVLPLGILAEESTRRRFRKEALALARLNHPNIETIYEFATENGIDFLIMEFIPGQTIAERLKAGPIAVLETMRFGLQMAEGLAAAHEKGVVHRDLKPGNLIVTPDQRLKILDFGLAQLLRPGQAAEATLSMSEAPGISGTLPYMSPEQLRGDAVDARSDIFSAGAVLYEMATGQRAFPEQQPARTIDSILNHAPRLPCALNPAITPSLESIVLKALDKEPGRRYQSARELHAALEALTKGEIPKRRPSRFMPLAGGSTLAVILLTGVILGLNVGKLRDRLSRKFSSSKAVSAPVSSIPRRRSVAVLGFKNVSGRAEAAWLSTGLSEMLTTELGTGEKVRTVSEENVSRAKTDLSLSSADSLAQDTLARLRKMLGTDFVVLGSYTALGKDSGGQIRLDLRLQDASTGETLGSFSATGTEAQLFDIVSRAGAQLREKLGVGALSEADAKSLRAAVATEPEASRLYAEGLTKLRVFDALTARDLLQKAVAADPKYGLAHEALSAAWVALGYDAKAREEAKQAFDLSANLPREQRLLIEGRYRETAGDWKKATEIYNSLVAFFPDNLDYGLRLANAQNRGGSPKDALEAVASLRKSAASNDVDPRIDIAEAEAARALADFKREQAAAETAIAKGEALGAQLLLARAVDLQGFALWKLGQPAPATASYERAKQIYSTAGDRNGVATELNRLAVVRWDQGDMDGAEKFFEDSSTICRESGNQGGIAAALNNLALVLLDRGDLARAGELYRQAFEIARNTGNKWGESITLANLGDTLSAQGNLKGARKVLEQAIAGFRQMGDKNNAALQSNELANVRFLQGDLAAAKNIQQEALAMGKATGDKRISAWALDNLGAILFARGDLAGSRKNYQEGLRLQDEIGEKGPAGNSRLGLADVSLAEGDVAQVSLPELRQVLQEFEIEKKVDAQIYAHAVLARALLAQGKAPDALKDIEAGEALAAKNQNLGVRLDLGVTAGEVRAALGNVGQAKANLESALAQANKAGFVGYQLDARLAIGKMALKSGNSTEAHDRLSALAKDAATKGYLLVSREAAEAIQ
jgi:serine/threonine protein kinase/Tfp pilus assembly protein PilF